MFYLGVDVSKAKLDCMLLDSKTNKVKAKSIPNTSAGFTQLIEWLAKNKAPDAYIVMEPTGVTPFGRWGDVLFWVMLLVAGVAGGVPAARKKLRWAPAGT